MLTRHWGPPTQSHTRPTPGSTSGKCRLRAGAGLPRGDPRTVPLARQGAFGHVLGTPRTRPLCPETPNAASPGPPQSRSAQWRTQPPAIALSSSPLRIWARGPRARGPSSQSTRRAKPEGRHRAPSSCLEERRHTALLQCLTKPASRGPNEEWFAHMDLIGPASPKAMSPPLKRSREIQSRCRYLDVRQRLRVGERREHAHPGAQAPAYRAHAAKPAPLQRAYAIPPHL